MTEFYLDLPADFLSLNSLNRDQFTGLLDLADELRGQTFNSCRNQVLSLLFEKPSTRTRVSFSVGMHQLGGDDIFMSPEDIQLKRGESIPDTARTLSRYVDIIACRTFEHQRIQSLAKHTEIPVINALTDDVHPCQALADVHTFRRHHGNDEFSVTYIGDGNNVCESLINAAELYQFDLTVCTPIGYEPDDYDDQREDFDSNHVSFVREPSEAVSTADFIYTDVWASMGEEDERQQRIEDFKQFQINGDLLRNAPSSAKVMHCLPAHRGEEITDEVMDGSRSIVFDQAENRLHAQKALLASFLIPSDELKSLLS